MEHLFPKLFSISCCIMFWQGFASYFKLFCHQNIKSCVLMCCPFGPLFPFSPGTPELRCGNVGPVNSHVIAWVTVYDVSLPSEHPVIHSKSFWQRLLFSCLFLTGCDAPSLFLFLFLMVSHGVFCTQWQDQQHGEIDGQTGLCLFLKGAATL